MKRIYVLGGHSFGAHMALRAALLKVDTIILPIDSEMEVVERRDLTPLDLLPEMMEFNPLDFTQYWIGQCKWKIPRKMRKRFKKQYENKVQNNKNS